MELSIECVPQIDLYPSEAPSLDSIPPRLSLTSAIKPPAWPVDLVGKKLLQMGKCRSFSRLFESFGGHASLQLDPIWPRFYLRVVSCPCFYRRSWFGIDLSRS